MEQNQNQKIESYARQLRLPVFRKHFLEYAQQAAKEKQSHEGYLLRLMILEQDERTERRLQQRVRRAKFPSQKLLVWKSRNGQNTHRHSARYKSLSSGLHRAFYNRSQAHHPDTRG